MYPTDSHTWEALHERLLPETPIFDYPQVSLISSGAKDSAQQSFSPHRQGTAHANGSRIWLLARNTNPGMPSLDTTGS